MGEEPDAKNLAAYHFWCRFVADALLPVKCCCKNVADHKNGERLHETEEGRKNGSVPNYGTGGAGYPPGTLGLWMAYLQKKH